MANYCPAFLLLCLAHFPWLVDIFSRHVFKFRDPKSDEFSVFVEIVGLFHNVEKENLAGAETCSEIPTGIVRMDIMVYQGLFEMLTSKSPILIEVKSKETGYDLPATV